MNKKRSSQKKKHLMKRPPLPRLHRWNVAFHENPIGKTVQLPCRTCHTNSFGQTFLLTNTAGFVIIIHADDTKSAGVAQPVEQLICNQQVGGSNPSTSSSVGRRGKLRTIHLSFPANNSYGGVPEWPKGADCKSVVSDFGGSNPPSSTIVVVSCISPAATFYK